MMWLCYMAVPICAMLLTGQNMWTYGGSNPSFKTSICSFTLAHLAAVFFFFYFFCIPCDLKGVVHAKINPPKGFSKSFPFSMEYARRCSLFCMQWKQWGVKLKEGWKMTIKCIWLVYNIINVTTLPLCEEIESQTTIFFTFSKSSAGQNHTHINILTSTDLHTANFQIISIMYK